VATQEQRARVAAQRRLARNLRREGGYKREFSRETARARSVRREYVERQFKETPAPPRSLAELRARVKEAKARNFGDDFKWNKRGADKNIDRFPAPRENYVAALDMDRETMRDYAARGRYDEGWRFLFYH
jgi:hypothetical protein